MFCSVYDVVCSGKISAHRVASSMVGGDPKTKSEENEMQCLL